METVVFDGVSYVKASVAAEQFHYSQDYIGQLCRGKKINARLVGRTWFVNVDSLKTHRRSRYQKEAQTSAVNSNTEKIPEVAFKNASSRKTEVVPFIKTVTLKQVQDLKSRQKERHLRVSYEFDDESLVPTIHKKREIAPRLVRIEHVDAKRVAISGRGATVTTFEADELPTVALSGAVTVTDIPDVAESDVPSTVQSISNSSDYKNKTISNDGGITAQALKGLSVGSDVPERGSKSRLATQLRRLPRKGVIQKPNHPSVEMSGRSAGLEGESIMVTESSESLPSFTPQSVRQRPVEDTPTIILVSPLIATVIAVGCVIVILMASASVTVNDSRYESHLVLQVANLLELLNQ